MVKSLTSVLLPTVSSTSPNEAARNNIQNKLRSAVERRRAQKTTEQQMKPQDALTLPENMNPPCPPNNKPGIQALRTSIAEQVICFESEDAICTPVLSK